MDTITLAILVASLAFIGLMKFLDKGKWQMKVIQAAFTPIAICKAAILRILLLHVEWKRWQVIAYKLTLCVMALSYFFMGAYSFSTNYSFTYNAKRKIKMLDKRGMYFITLFILSTFELSCEMVRTMGNFDYTHKLKYVYRIKSINEKRMQKQKQIKFQRRESRKLTIYLKQKIC